MRNSLFITTLSVALAVATPVFVQAQGANTPDASSATLNSPLTATQIEQAVKDGNLEALLSSWLGANPTAEQLAALNTLLTELAASKPALAAQVAVAAGSIASTLAADNPQAAMSIAEMAIGVISNPAVIAAAPSVVGAATVALSEASTLAQRSAEAKGITLANSAAVSSALAALAANPAVLSATPDVASQIQGAVELANAQADLAGFAPAAGPGAETGAAGPTSGAGTLGSSSFASFGNISGGTGSGGTQTPASPAI
ncbi:hypothetical protein [Thiobaca trueperi]|uniref:Uncharacterized protein n=1 Tax=Thiobaca trueperi TaxID=127458 RepID=A0A4R3MWL4_9GAMM|nr:hypothetical protein [Thiobaca trueperi]TCT18689.1 hypothetical protein EDC35_11212 [Thiobaca trueperi]